MSGWHVAVVIPAHNEEGSIGPCIRSVLHAAQTTAVAEAVWVVVAADHCSDATAEIARAALGSRGQVVTLDAQRAGTARRLGTQAALQRFADVARERIWVACTDADSCVREDWLLTQLATADQGYQGLAGIIQLLDATPHVQQVHDATYPVQDDGSHEHVHGANLAFRADAYLDAGGWRDVALAEDHCLWSRLLSRGWRLRSSAASVVLTSARLKGRAAGGFATTLGARLQRAAASAGGGACREPDSPQCAGGIS